MAESLPTMVESLSTKADGLPTMADGLSPQVEGLSLQVEIPKELFLRIKKLGKRITDKAEMEKIIIELCEIRDFSSNDLASITNRDEKYLKKCGGWHLRGSFWGECLVPVTLLEGKVRGTRCPTRQRCKCHTPSK